MALAIKTTQKNLGVKSYLFQFLRNASSQRSSRVFQQTRIGVVGAPLDRGQSKAGTEDGPKTCRDSGFISYLQDALQLDVKDYGDIDFGLSKRIGKIAQTQSTNGKYGKLRNVEEVAQANQKISEAVRHILLDNRLSLTLGGDHSIAIGSIHGVTEVHPDLALLWVDAHADINTTPTTTTGNLHGMPVSFLIKELERYNEKFSVFDWITPRIRADNIAYIGLRDLDFGERFVIDQLGITAYGMKEVDKYGIRAVTRMALEKITARGTKPLHLSFDVDALDDAEVLTTGTPVPGGLTLREAHVLLEEIHASQSMVSMDFVEVNPILGSDTNLQRTLNVVRQLLTTAFGNERGGISAGVNVVPVYPIDFTQKHAKTTRTN